MKETHVNPVDRLTPAKKAETMIDSQYATHMSQYVASQAYAEQHQRHNESDDQAEGCKPGASIAG